jgi:hypothetical protein
MLRKLNCGRCKRRLVSYYLFPVLLLLSLHSFSQNGVFIPTTENTESLKTSLTAHELSFQATLKSLPKEFKKDFEETYTSRWKNIKEKFDLGEIYTSAPAQQYLDKIINEITNSNSLLKDKNFKAYFSRSGVPNASYMGEGVMLVNMGLFYRLGNESQLAFVICHEIAHYYLKHSDIAIDAYVRRINSREFQNELRDIKKTEYGKRERLENLTKKFSFDSRRHTRQNEHQADSMAVEFLKNTKFNLTEAVKTLALLDTIDIDSLDIETSLTTIFNSPEYPFQKRWLRKEQGLLGGHATLKQESWSDSLKTHPDCNKRIAQLNPFIEKYRSGNLTTGIDTNNFRKLQHDFRYEIIEYEYKSENFSRALFSCLMLMSANTPDPYLVTMIGKSMNSIYLSFKSHRLSKVTDLPSPGAPSNYNQLCQFIQNLYAENVASISYHFLLRYKNSMGQNKDFQTAFEDISKAIQK